MFWTGILIGLSGGACFGFVLSSFFFAKLESSSEGKSSTANSVELPERNVAPSDEFILNYLERKMVRFDKVPN